MKIIYFITGLTIGGAEVVTVNLANAMVLKGYDVTIVCLSGKNEWMNRISYRIKVVNLEMKKNCVGFIRAQKKAVQIISEIKPDVIHSHMFHSNIFVRLLRLHTNIAYLVTTEHNKYIGGIYRMWMYRLTDKLSDINTNVSEEATKYFIDIKAFSKKKTVTIYNGINLNQFQCDRTTRSSIRAQLGINDDVFLFLNVGRLTTAKNQQGLVKAFANVVLIKPNVKLLIVGNGELRNNLLDLVESLSLSDKIIFLPAQLNICDFYNAADCFVLFSSWEGFGLVLAEAMACQLPVIATNAGGCAEVVSNENYVIPVGDSNLLIKKMLEICQMSLEERVSLGRDNRKLVMRFDINYIEKQWDILYQRQMLYL